MNIKRILKFLIIFLVLFELNVHAYNKSVIDVTKMDIPEIQKALEKKLITSEELVSLYLDRIDSYDKNYNAIITINESAIEQAKELDKLREKGQVKGLLHGIPIIVKDNIDVVGMPTTAGAKALKDNFPKTNSFAVQKLLDAGAIILAKSNMSEFAFYASSSRSSYGTVKNAYNTEYSSYGSSGGSAVAVAANFAVASLGTDTNSSVRLPASANNLVGLRPTVGLVSRSGVLPYDAERDTIGSITKTVADSIILMNIINGYDSNDHKSINQDSKIYNVSKTDLDGITIGIPKPFLEGSNSNGLPENKATYEEVKQLMESAIQKMISIKAEIVYIDEYYTFETDNWYSVSVSGYTFCDAFNQYIKNTTGNIRSFQSLSSASGKITPLGGYTGSCGSYNMSGTVKEAPKTAYKNYVNKIMNDNNIDVIAYPSSKNKLLKSSANEGLQNLSSHASSTINYPSITVPLGFDSDMIPYGIEFMASTSQEELLYNIASAYESVNGNDIKNSPLTPSLYEIPESVQKLVDNYIKVIAKKTNYGFEENWIKNVVNYFREYTSNEEASEEAEALNLKYQTNKGLSTLLTALLFFIKWFLIIIGGIFVLLLVRKSIRRQIKRRKKLNKIGKRKKT